MNLILLFYLINTKNVDELFVFTQKFSINFTIIFSNEYNRAYREKVTSTH